MPPNLPFIQGDQDRLLQVLINVLNNACQYTPAGGAVRVEAGLRDNEIVIAIADNGAGIPAEHISKLFARFYRVDKSRSRDMGGTGLGLSIVKHILEAHGQTISVMSTEGAGSVFSFTLKKG